MSEQSSVEQGGDIKLPSALRIKQRLGHISTDKVFKKKLVPSIQKYGNQRLPGRVFLAGTTLDVVEYANVAKMNVLTALEHYVPKLITQVVDDKEQAFWMRIDFRDNVLPNYMREPAQAEPLVMDAMQTTGSNPPVH